MQVSRRTRKSQNMARIKAIVSKSGRQEIRIFARNQWDKHNMIQSSRIKLSLSLSQPMAMAMAMAKAKAKATDALNLNCQWRINTVKEIAHICFIAGLDWHINVSRHGWAYDCMYIWLSSILLCVFASKNIFKSLTKHLYVCIYVRQIMHVDPP